jgi:hypothetical protein
MLLSKAALKPSPATVSEALESGIIVAKAKTIVTAKTKPPIAKGIYAGEDAIG